MTALGLAKRDGKKRLEEEERYRRMRLDLGLTTAPLTREALQAGGPIRAEYENAVEAHYCLRVPAYLDRIEHIALHSKSPSASIKACELLLKVCWRPYQRLVFGEALQPKDSIGQALKDILKQAGRSGRARIVERVVEINATEDATDAKDSVKIEEGDSAKASSGTIVEGQASVQ